RLVPRFALQVAEEQRGPVMLWQAVQLFFQDDSHFLPADIVAACQALGHRGPALVLVTTRRSHFGLGGYPFSDGKQPVRYGFLDTKRPRLPGQEKEGSLEGVLGILGLVENAPAGAQN